MSAVASGPWVKHQTYYCAMRPESVEMDDWLKAGHCVDPDKGIQFCAIATGVTASAASRIDFIVDGWLHFVYRRCWVTVEGDRMSWTRVFPFQLNACPSSLCRCNCPTSSRAHAAFIGRLR